MAPTKYPLASFHLKFQTTTVLLPITTTTTLNQLRTLFLSALIQSRPKEESEEFQFEPKILPNSIDEIAFYKKINNVISSKKGEEDNDEIEEDIWELLIDEKSGAGNWGLKEAAEIGVSFKDSTGAFPSPNVIRPIDEDEMRE